MKDKKQELELSILSEETKFQHKILDRAFIDALTAIALEEIEQEQMEMWHIGLYIEINIISLKLLLEMHIVVIL